MTTTRKTRQHKHVIGPFNVDKNVRGFKNG